MIGDFFRGTADFDISKQLIGVHVGAGDDLLGAILLTLGLSNLDLTVGDTSGVYVEVKSGTLALASLTAPTPATGTDSRTWIAFEGSVGTITFHGIPGVGLTIADLALQLNTKSGTSSAHGDAAALDWGHALDLNDNQTYGETAADTDQLVVGTTPINLSGDLLQASGSATVNLLDFVTGSVTFTFRQQSVDIDADGDGTFDPGAPLGSTPGRGPPDVANATLTTLGLTVTSISIGIPNGPRLTATGGTLALAVVTQTASNDTRSWIALTSDIATVSFTGFTGFDAHGSGIHIEINTAQGLYDPAGLAVAPLALDWTADVLSGGTPVDVDTGSGTIAFTTETFDVTGTLGFEILGFVLAQGTLHVSRAAVTVTDPAANGGAAVSGTLLTISVSGGDAFIGTGASFSGSTLVHAGATGFYLGLRGLRPETARHDDGRVVPRARGVDRRGRPPGPRRRRAAPEERHREGQPLDRPVAPRLGDRAERGRGRDAPELHYDRRLGQPRHRRHCGLGARRRRGDRFADARASRVVRQPALGARHHNRWRSSPASAARSIRVRRPPAIRYRPCTAGVIDEAVAKKAQLVEIIPGKGWGALKKHVLRFLDRKEIKALYHRVEKDSDNFGRIFVHFRWK